MAEFITYLLFFLAMVFLSSRRSKKHEEPSDEEEEEELLPAVRQVFHTPEPPPQDMAATHTPDEFELQMIEERSTMTGLQKKLFHSPGEKGAYKLKVRSRQAEISWLLESDLQEAFVLKEILGKPKGL